ncbi:3-isopropylmalate dehydrogenase [Methylopila jiangsuensis]|uniref:3-isopropylmalate dehydrogenase n=1 Tax=Methylopila jiangsuensis TaxID=586230 RepID=A0A9W6JJZ4_9HYPH|nr:3-isopropylmalate dehydrogenase [Methylopila jiangsuensis]MDR6284828.1 3-isopropylmalate dehydrogenase [Methylopila jiangsuensis]GLK77781.1 3-isopropylmalate dehydrogenase [Methylopila jiangsuensis]
MAAHNILLLPGDGIGPEVMGEVKRILGFLNDKGALAVEIDEDLVGGSAYDVHGKAISDEAVAKAHKADAVLLGAVGGPKWDGVAYEHRPEAGLLRLRKDLELFANLRPAICYPALADASALKRELVDGLDLMIVRELTGGVYFGEPKEITDLPNGQKRAVDTQVYETYEIERIAKVAFELARVRSGRVTSAEKRNVMKSGLLWNQVVTATHKQGYEDVKLDHMLADALGMQLVRAPKQFDVIVTDNLFGDILSDVASMLTGSLGMLPSASLGAEDPATGKRKALYEPVHGSAPDIAGKGVANPLAMIASLAMALKYSLGKPDLADTLDRAIAGVLESGVRTGDIYVEGATRVGTSEMGAAVLSKFEALLAA